MPTPCEDMIRIQSLDKSYGARQRAVPALRKVSVRLEPGTWGVVGPNGAGKTTLLGLVLGFLQPTAGSITVDGVSPRRYVRRHGAGYLPERFRLPPEWPVRQALAGFARLEGLTAAAARAAVEGEIDRLGLHDYADRPFGTLSRGLAQRVGIAQALLADRRLVVLDEPGEGLDPLWRVRLRDILTDAPGDRTTLVASHDLAEIERIADRVVVLDDGRVRDVLDARGEPATPTRYRLVTDADREDVLAAFPGAKEHPGRGAGPAGPGDAPGGGDGGKGGDGGAGEGQGPRVFTVEVADARELSHRLAALLGTGSTIRALVPLGSDLETRVRDRLEDG